MLDDRDYMRPPVYRDRPRVPPMSFTIALLIVNAVVFLIECAVYGYPLRFPVDPADSYFALSVEGLKHGYVWQLLTYQFMHAGVLHILLNGWAIYVFGHSIEEALGWKKYLTLYLSSGVIGGICQVLAALLWPNLFGGPVVGASAGAFGLAPKAKNGISGPEARSRDQGLDEGGEGKVDKGGLIGRFKRDKMPAGAF